VKYSKTTRELAALECSVNACNRGGVFARFDVRDIRRSIGESGWSGSLASAAFNQALPFGSIAFRDAWAEAEALIRTGWSPP
jgi:hypothetical protein